MAAWSNSGQHTELFVRGMRCEKCVDLWTEYGLALRLALDPDKPETGQNAKSHPQRDRGARSRFALGLSRYGLRRMYLSIA